MRAVSLSDESNETFGKYKLVSLVAQGFTGEAYRAIDTESDEAVLLRVLRPDISKLPQFRRALCDTQTTNDLLIDHPNIAGLRDSGKIQGRHYFATEFIEGQSLEDRLQGEPFAAHDAIGVLVQIAEGLRAAHRRQLVHGDLKPSCIFLTQDRRGQLLVKIVFFDLATTTADSGVSIFGELVGTPKYMSPEQIMGKPADVRSDIYALGVTAYRMLTGKHPFGADTALGFLYANLNEPPLAARQVNPKVPLPLSAVVSRMLEKTPAARYQSCQNLIDDLERCEHQISTDRTALLPAGTDSAFAVKAPARAASTIGLKTLIIAASVLIIIFMVGAMALIAYALREDRQRAALRPDQTALSQPPGPAPVAVTPEEKARLLLERGKTLHDSKLYEDALRIFQQVVQQHPQTIYAQQAETRRQETAAKIKELAAKQAQLKLQRQTREAGIAFQNAAQAADASVEAREYLRAATVLQKFMADCQDPAHRKQAQSKLCHVNFLLAKDLLAKKQFALSLGKLKELSDQSLVPQLATDALALEAEALLLWAKDLLAAHKGEEALPKLEQVARDYAKTPWATKAQELAAQATFESACSLLDKRDYQKAIAEFRKVSVKYRNTEWEAKAAKSLADASFAYADQLLNEQQYQEALNVAKSLEPRLHKAEWQTRGEPFVAKLLFAWSEALAEDGKQAQAEEKRQALLKDYGQTEWAKQLQRTRKPDAPPPPKPVGTVAVRRVDENRTEDEAKKLVDGAKKLMAENKFEPYLAKLAEVIKAYPKTEAARAAAELMPRAIFEQGRRLMAKGMLQEGMEQLDRVAEQYPKTEWANRAAQQALARQQTPEGMVYVIGGDFLMGTTEQDTEKLAAQVHGPDAAKYAKIFYRPETPQVLKHLDPFYIDRTEVTNADYLKFVKATGRPAPPYWEGRDCPKGLERLPVVNVTWQDADAYAKWLHKRLPTEPEWEFAARGCDGRAFPWGAVFDRAKCNTKEADLRGPLPVGSFPTGASPFGCMDMCGNVSEWTKDPFEPYPNTVWESTEQDRRKRVFRGGSWVVGCSDARVSSRFGAKEGEARATIGFRCADSVKLGGAKPQQ